MRHVTKLCVQCWTGKADRGSHQERLSFLLTDQRPRLSIVSEVRGRVIDFRLGTATPRTYGPVVVRTFLVQTMSSEEEDLMTANDDREGRNLSP